MARKRLSMRKRRGVLRLKYGLGRSHRKIETMLRISHSTVGSYVRRAREAGVSRPLPDELDDRSLETGAVSGDPPVAGSASGAGLGARSPGVGAAQWCDALAAVAGVPRGAPRRLSVQPLL